LRCEVNLAEILFNPTVTSTAVAQFLSQLFFLLTNSEDQLRKGLGRINEYYSFYQKIRLD